MELTELRDKIDDIDKQIVELFCRRMKISHQVSEYKIEHSLPVLDAGRERRKLAKIAEMAGEEYATYACTLYNTVFEVSRAEQEKLMHPVSRVGKKIKSAIDATPEIFPE